MTRYVALLRGVNVSGKNKLSMADLKAALEALPAAEVKTYLNSGNAAFSSEETDVPALTQALGDLLRTRCGLSVPVLVLPQADLASALDQAPDWWGSEDKEIYDNLIFLIPPVTLAQVHDGLGDPKDGLEWAQDHQEAMIFWSFRRKDYQKTNWWPRTASVPVGQQLTIRTAGTVRKLAVL